MSESVTLAALHAANIARQAEWCPDQVPDLSFRGNELGGECGEAQNVIKKIERERHGWAGSRATKEQLAEELADVVICADLCAVTAGIDLGASVVAKFNATSEKVGLATRLVAEPGNGWLPIGDKLNDAGGYSHLPDGEDAGLGWYVDADDRLLFLLWWADLGNGRSEVTHWRPLLAGPASLHPVEA